MTLALDHVDKYRWPHVQDDVAAQLSAGTMRLGAALDGLVILAKERNDPNFRPEYSTSFNNTAFPQQRLAMIQDSIKALKSPEDPAVSLKFVDFGTVYNFWKHYIPYQPSPQDFTNHDPPVRDFQIDMVDQSSTHGCSGPLMLDIILPTFNHAVDLVHELAMIVQVPQEVVLVQKI